MQNSLFDATQRDEFWKALKAGEKMDCPCCRRHSQIYKRRLHSTVAWQLIRLYKLNGYAEYINGAELILPGAHSTSDLPLAKHWELIERRDLVAGEEHKKTSGWWRLTGKGVGYVTGSATIREIVMLFDNTIIGFGGKEVDIQHALRRRFDYKALMAS